MRITDVIGLQEEDAVTKLEDAGFSVRITSRNGESFFGTCDYLTNRVNLEIEDDKVVTAIIG